jgi:hypothetical protein
MSFVRRILTFVCACTFALVPFVPRAAQARVHLVAVLPLRSTPALASKARLLGKHIASQISLLDGYEGTYVESSAAPGMAAAGAGAEYYVTGQLIGDGGDFSLTLAGFETATDREGGTAHLALTDPTALPSTADLRSLFAPVSAAASSPSTGANPTETGRTLVPAGLLVALKVNAPVSSASAKVGDTIALSAADDVIVDGHVIVKKVAEGQAEVMVAEHSGGNGHAGKLGLQFDWVAATDGSKIKLSNTQHAQDGEGNKGAASTATIASYVLLGPLGLFAHNFVHGRDITIDDKTTLKAYVDQTVHIAAPLQSAMGNDGFAK